MKKLIVFLSIIIGAAILNGCTKLKEEILDETSVIGQTEKQKAEGVIAPVYALLPNIFQHTRYFALQEISTDEAILPYRGGTDWGDNGIYVAMHTHNFSVTDPNIRNTWNDIVTSIARSVSAISALPTINDPSTRTFLAEARAMRAYYSMLTLDLFGLVFVKEDPNGISTIIRGNDAVEYIASELIAAEPNLETNVGPGRMTKAAAWGLLARLYLNAAVYRDVYASSFDFRAADMDKVIEFTDKIIASNQFQLSPDYFALFNDNNNSNKELIFVVDQRADLNGHNRLAYFSLSGDQFPLPEFPGANGTDGPAITSDFYRTWVNAYAPIDPAAADPRFYRQNVSIYTNPADSCVPAAQYNVDRGILRGPQYGLIRRNGVFVRCANGNFKVGPLFHDTRNRPTLAVNYTERVDFTVEGSNYFTGFRVGKYEFGKKSVSGRNFGEADIVILRLADIYLMRAEAKLRKGLPAANALTDVNTVRASRTFSTPPPPLATINLDLLYRERGFEFYWEMLRRTDMIRFDKFKEAWTEKAISTPQKRIFPIPQNSIDGSSIIPNYLNQNAGY